MPGVHAVLDKMGGFADRVRSGEWTGHTGKRIKNVVNIGIGGSDLGPAMAYEALRAYTDRDLTVRFVSNVDGADLHEAVRDLDPAETLFIVASKTFTTIETITNADLGPRRGCSPGSAADDEAVAKHFVALSTNAEKVADVRHRHGQHVRVLGLGRRPLLLRLGDRPVADDRDRPGRASARCSTASTWSTSTSAPRPPEANAPLLLGLLGIWYGNFHDAQSHAVLPYSHYLSKFTAYLQQLDMESNGKSVDRDGNPVEWQTGPGRVGHARHQRPARLLPADPPGHEADPGGLHRLRPAGRRAAAELAGQHDLLMANFFAQTQALAFGKTPDEVAAEGVRRGAGPAQDLPAATTRRPRSWPRELTPSVLGQLIALYEHKVFVQGAVWNIDSFDQWGVELGKVLAKRVEPALTEGADVPGLDASTTALVATYRELRGAAEPPETPDVAGSRPADGRWGAP